MGIARLRRDELMENKSECELDLSCTVYDCSEGRLSGCNIPPAVMIFYCDSGVKQRSSAITVLLKEIHTVLKTNAVNSQREAKSVLEGCYIFLFITFVNFIVFSLSPIEFVC